MPTTSEIVESAFRLGCGRYIQESGAVSEIGEEILRLKCKKPFILGGKTALSIARDPIRKSLAEHQLQGSFYTYTGFCNTEICNDLIRSSEMKDCDVIVGVGGGNIMDAAKYCAATKQVPVINIPTSSATCAATTPLSVCYNAKGQTLGSIHHKTEVNAVLVDMDILCRQPVRLLVSGIYDSLAKLYETNQRIAGQNPDDVDVGLAASYRLSRYMCDYMNRKKAECVADVAAQKCTKTVYDMVYLTIALTGLISGLARGSNQCAIAHKIYEDSRIFFPQEVYPFLHGELVAIGLIAQIAYNENEEITPEQFAAEMKHFGMPTALHEVGIRSEESVLRRYYDKLIASSVMVDVREEEKVKLYRALKKIQ